MGGATSTTDMVPATSNTWLEEMRSADTMAQQSYMGIYTPDVTEIDQDTCPYAYFINGSIREGTRYMYWDNLLTKPPSDEDVKSVIGLLKVLCKIPRVTLDREHYHDISAVINTAIEGDVISPELILIVSIRSDAAFQSFLSMLITSLFKLADQGLYGSGINTADHAALEQVLVWTKALIGYFIKYVPQNMSVSFSLGTDLLRYGEIVDDIDDDGVYTKPPIIVNKGWSQYAGASFSKFIFTLLNVIMFSKNYTIPSDWVESLPKDANPVHHIVDAARIWATGFGSTQQVPAKIRTDDVTDEMWTRRCNLLEIIIMLYSEGIYKDLHHPPMVHGKENTNVQGVITADGFPYILDVAVAAQEVVSELSTPMWCALEYGNGVIALTSTMFVSLLGLVQNYSLTMKESPMKRCCQLAIRAVANMVNLPPVYAMDSDGNIVTQKRNVFYSIVRSYEDSENLALLTHNCAIILSEYDMKNEASEHITIMISVLTSLLSNPLQLSLIASDSSLYRTLCITMGCILYKAVCVRSRRLHPSEIYLYAKFMARISEYGYARHSGCFTGSADSKNAAMLKSRVQVFNNGELLLAQLLEVLTESQCVKPNVILYAKKLTSCISCILCNVAANVEDLSFPISDHILSLSHTWTKTGYIFKKTMGPIICQTYFDLTRNLILPIDFICIDGDEADLEKIRNPYVIYAVLRRVDQIRKFSLLSFSDESVSFKDAEEFIKWRDTLGSLRLLNDIIVKILSTVTEWLDNNCDGDSVDYDAVLGLLKKEVWRSRRVRVDYQNCSRHVFEGELSSHFVYSAQLKCQIQLGVSYSSPVTRMPSSTENIENGN